MTPSEICYVDADKKNFVDTKYFQGCHVTLHDSSRSDSTSLFSYATAVFPHVGVEIRSSCIDDDV